MTRNSLRFQIENILTPDIQELFEDPDFYIIEENVIAKIHNFNHESTYSKNNSKKTVFGLGTFDLG